MPSERQAAVNDLYRLYREAGDDPMNARLRLLDEEQTGSPVTMLEADIAQLAIDGEADEARDADAE